jgi:N-acylneuraminate cytidylyltransferase
MKILALIPARGGSKRLPGKNIKNLATKPLIVWSIDVAKRNQDICDILVSTDSPDIAAIARDSGTLAPWLRPAVLSSDTAPTLDVALHALDWYEREKGIVDGLLLLQPSSPFRSDETVRHGIDLFRRNPQRSVVGVSPAVSHPMWCFRVVDDAIIPFLEGGGLHLRSQDLPPAYVVNGAFYLLAPDYLRNSRSFYNEPVPLVMNDPREALDIDTDYDWLLAEAILGLNCRT